MDFKGRQAKLRNLLDSNRFDAFLVTHLPNVRYLCGFTGSAGVLVVSEDKTVFFTDGRYTEQARAEVRGAKIVIGKKGPLAAAVQWLGLRRGYRVGVETERLSAGEYARVKVGLPKTVRLQPAPPLVEQLRMIKDADELEKIRTAVRLGSSLFDRLLEVIRPGVAELEVAAELEYAAAKGGAEGMSFATIIASGERSALPHGRASRQAIPASGFVVCDFGVILGGYCSDMTRTVYVGRPSAEAKRFYGAVLDAQLAAVAAVAAGKREEQVDQAARKLLQKMGLGKYFTHSTGHGVGLEIHEPPRLATGQKTALRSGMVITAEPGAYIPGKWGVRIEDMVVVTDSGCEVLTPTPKDLIAI
ncbi:MAG TPA: Xaa-Pro peptidase family protein [Terriglobales bacterium]|jgi:Xaa-Pro aminopeptidase|nr:Xaa-Pro peptidase family protein [Terriglobales bacterium]